MKKQIIAAFFALATNGTAFAENSECMPVDVRSALTTIVATDHVSSDMVSRFWFKPGWWYDTSTARTNGTLAYQLVGEDEPVNEIPSASVAGGCR